MRTLAGVLCVMLVLSGCITGGGDDADELDRSETAEAQRLADQEANRTAGNATGNATYLRNTDYNRSHVHDYWGEATTKVLMDETVSTETFFSVFYTTFSPLFDEPQTDVGVVFFALPNGTFVPEGTGLLHVEIDATSALKQGQVQLSYLDATSDSFTELPAQGAQATWTIETSPTMVDLPHAKSSRWGFLLEADGAGGVLDGDIAVTVTAEKTREIEAWPEHPDFWEAGTREKMHLMSLNETFQHQETFVTQVADGQEEGEAIALPPGTIVPPETSILLVKLWYGMDESATNQANGGVHLLVEEGSSNRGARLAWSDQVRTEEGFKMYAIPVTGATWDSPYAEESQWSFGLYVPMGMRDPQDGSEMMTLGIAELGAGNITLDVTAYREIPGWLQEEVQQAGERGGEREAETRGQAPRQGQLEAVPG